MSEIGSHVKRSAGKWKKNQGKRGPYEEEGRRLVRRQLCTKLELGEQGSAPVFLLWEGEEGNNKKSRLAREPTESDGEK